MSLQYNGVNLRCATYEQAAMILKQSGNSVTILAQFNPDKFKDTSDSLSSQSEASTTCSTPVTRNKHEGGSSTPPIRRNGEILPIIDNEPPGDLRYVFFTKSPSTLGFSIAGGNAMGIFVSELQADDEAAKSSGLTIGDHILEVRGWHNVFYYIDRSVLLENTPRIKFIRNYIRDPCGVFELDGCTSIVEFHCILKIAKCSCFEYFYPLF